MSLGQLPHHVLSEEAEMLTSAQPALSCFDSFQDSSPWNGATHVHGGSSLPSQSSLETPSLTCPEARSLGDAESCQVTNPQPSQRVDAQALQWERLTAVDSCAEKGLGSGIQAQLKHTERKYAPQWEQTKKNPHPPLAPLLKTGRGGDTSQPL